jgi:hypothetical protein
MRITQIIAELYGRGVDCGLETYQGAGVLAWIVDESNRRKEACFAVDQLDSIPEWLLAAASREVEAREGFTHEETAHVLLAELAGVARKEAKQISVHERKRRHAARMPADDGYAKSTSHAHIR